VGRPPPEAVNVAFALALRQEGWRVPTGTAEGFSRRVLALPLPGRLRSEVAPLLAVMRQVTQQVDYSDERIAALTQTDERVRRLRSVPNIGPVTAAAFVAALDDAHRFGRAHEVEAYVGLVPREWRSGETQRRGRIPQSGVGASAVAADPRRGVDAAPARSAHGGAAGVGGADCRPAGKEDRGGGAGASARGDPLCAAARWDRVRAPGGSVPRPPVGRTGVSERADTLRA